MKRPLRAVALTLVGAVLAMQSWAASPRVTLDYDRAEAAQVIRAIARQWGVPVTLPAGLHGKVTLHVKNLSAEEAMNRVLAQLGGSWKLVDGKRLVVSLAPVAQQSARPKDDSAPKAEVSHHPETLTADARKRSGETMNMPFSRPAPAPSGGIMGRSRGVVASSMAMRQEQWRNSDEAFNTEGYDHKDEKPFLEVTRRPLSTFSADVDTGSYSNVRRFAKEGKLPPADAVRIEEMLNYFRYDYPEPSGADPVSITTTVAKCPWSPEHQLMQVGLRSKSLPAAATMPARNLVFLIDVSGSMQSPDKLPLVISSLQTLTDTLDDKDHVSLVVYAGSSGVALEPTSGDHKSQIRDALAQLQAGGSTHGSEGIKTAYALARKNYQKDAVNRVILCSDGDFNVGTTSQGELVKIIEKEREAGIFLTVLGFGTGNLKDATMEQLADKGNGNYAYIDSLSEARKVLVKEGGANLVTVAKDVKLQVEFNPARIAGYRLIGYENRELQDRDFNDDKKDAGEMGLGHTVTALYELVPAGQPVPGATTDPLRYQDAPTPKSTGGDELAFVKVPTNSPPAMFPSS